MYGQAAGQNLLRNLTWRSLRRNHLTSILLLLFVVLSALLASAAATLLITGTGAAASLMQQASTPHFMQMHVGELDRQRLEDFADSNPQVEQFEAVRLLNFDGTALEIGDRTLATGLQDNSFVKQSELFDFLLNTDGQVIEPAAGTVWLPLYYMELLDLEAGQTLTVRGADGTVALTIAGFLRDSQMNSSYASSKRLLVHEADLTELAELGGSDEYMLQYRLTDAGAAAGFEAVYRAAGLEANGPTLSWSLFSLINSLSAGITAAVIILVTLLLVGIAILCVRFILLTTIELEYREIGVLKALGVPVAQVRRLYGNRYLLLAAVGALLGWLLSPLLGRMLLRDIELYMGPAGRTVPSLLAGLALCLLIVGAIMLAVRAALKRLEAVSPVQAIRTGGSDEGSRGRSVTPSLLAGGTSLNVRLGVRDVLNRLPLYVVPLIIFTLAAFILVVPQNLLTTVTEPGFITYMGTGVSDMRIEVPQGAGVPADIRAALAGDPDVAEYAVLTTAEYPIVGTDGVDYSLKVESGNHSVFPLTYLRGSAPVADGQLALSSLQADELNAAPGDEIELDGTPFTVTAIYQDVTNGGKTAKISSEHSSDQLMWSTVYVDFSDGVDGAAAITGYALAWPELKVSSVSEFVGVIMGGTVSALEDAALASILIGLAVAALITALFMPLLLARDSFPIAVMRALGFRSAHIQQQYVTRALLILLPGVIVGAILANLLGGGLAGLLLGPVGLTQLQLIANPWLAYLAAPAALAAVVTVATLLSTRPRPAHALSADLKE